MLLKRLEMYGFKSFAERIRIEFNEGITAIVGPNGSGKSNVADAVRWVLGEQSAKSLRGSKMEDIIFSGTQVRRPLGFAEVSLTLDNTDNSIPLDFTEVTVTRRVFRSGESEYYINRSPCRLRDINELFMDTGIGMEGYSIIGQGRIEEILSTQPENRRRIFEEAAGIAKYKSRKQESERKLESVQNNILRIHDILSEIHNRLDPLKKQSETAKEYLSLKDGLKFYDLNKFIIEYDKSSKRIETIKENISLLDEDLVRHRSHIDKSEDSIGSLNGEMLKIDKEIQSLNNQRYNNLNEIERLKGKKDVCQEKIIQLERDILRTEDEIKKGKGTIEGKETEKKEIHKTMGEKSQIHESLTQRIKGLEIKSKEYQVELQRRREITREKKNQAMEIWNKLSETKNFLAKLETQNINLKERKEQAKNRFYELEKKRDGLNDRYNDITKKLANFKGDQRRKIGDKSDLEKDIGVLQENMDILNKDLEGKVREFEGKKSRLKLLMDLTKSYDGFQRTVKRIMTALNNNPSLGKRICGVVADLVEVPKGYETAIEIALGAGLQHIVTRDENDAKYVIDFLKQRGWGRATFLPISTIKPRYLNDWEKKVLSMEGVLGSAFDIIDCKSEFMDVFANLLGRTLIMDNLDHAIIAARKFSHSFRIVTLDGDVLNTGGSMTGGSSGRANTGIIGRDREISAMREELSRLTGEIKELNNKKNSSLMKLNESSSKLNDLNGQIHMLEIQITQNTEILDGIKDQTEGSVKDIKGIEHNLSQIDLERENTKVLLKEKRALVETLDRQVKEEELKTQDFDASAESIEADKGQIDEEITELKVEMAGLFHEIQTLREKAGQVDLDIEGILLGFKEKRLVLDENKHAISQQKTQIREYKDEIERLNLKAKEKEIHLEENQTLKEELTDKIERIETEKKDLTKTIDEIRERKQSMEIQLSKIQIEVQNMQDNIWDEYEISYAGALGYRDEKLSLSFVQSKIRETKKQISGLGDVNVNAIEEYKNIKDRYDFLLGQKEDLNEAREDLKRIIGDITKTMEDRFKEEFSLINKYFNGVFCRLFGGGRAELILENPEDVLASGIEIIAQPPGKKLQSITLLSGGEKALTAISILFAILEHKPSPFCVLDEIEAALDENNVLSFGGYLKELCDETQFVLITHRKGTMENSHALYGVTMEEKGVSRVISVKLEDEIAS